MGSGRRDTTDRKPAFIAAPRRTQSCRNRGHGATESKNHRRRDTAFRDDACMVRTGAANYAALRNFALAIILTAGFDRIPVATDHFE